MDAFIAQSLAQSLMRKWGLEYPRWSFRWDHAKRRCGSCRQPTVTVTSQVHRDGTESDRVETVTRAGQITLSRHYVAANNESDIVDTILHEIAHALCPPAEGHGPAWRAMCRKVGAKPIRCAGREVKMPDGNWVYTCSKCGKFLRRRIKRVSRHWMRTRSTICCSAGIVETHAALKP